MSNRAALYGRKSSPDPRNPGKSVADQIREARAEAYRRDLCVVGEYEDDEVSASRFAKGRRRPGWTALVEAVERGEVDVIVVAEQSRASRRLSEVGALVELCAERQVRLVMGGREYDPSRPGDLAVIGVTGTMDAVSSEQTRERVRRGMRGSAERGRQHGKLAYGYARHYDPVTRALASVTVVEPEAAVIRETAERLLAGESLRRLATDFTTRGLLVPRDAVAERQGRDHNGQTQWNPTTVRRLATNPLYAALRVHDGKVVGDGDWPPIITRIQHDRLDAVFSDQARKRTKPGAVKHLLSGIARCGVCDGPVVVFTNRGKYRSYACRHRFCVARTADPTDAFVRDVVVGLVERPGFLAALAAVHDDDSGAREAVEAMEALTARRAAVQRLVVDGAIPPEDGAAMLRDLAEQVAAAERDARQTVLPRRVADVVPARLAERWDDLDITVRREVVAAFVDVRIMPSGKHRTFDPKTVLVTPKA